MRCTGYSSASGIPLNTHNVAPEEAPIIAYCAIHKAIEEAPKESYVATMRDLHQLIETESVTLRKQGDLRRQEFLDKEVRTLSARLGDSRNQNLLKELSRSFGRYWQWQVRQVCL